VDKVDGWLEVIEDHDGTLNDLDSATVAWSGPIGIQLHGSSSLSYPKNNYRFEIRDDDGEDLDIELLGLPDASDWVLHGPYPDKTLFRNALAYHFARELAAELDHWQVNTRFLELFIDGAYLGAYTLVDRVDRDADRLALPDPAPTAADGDLSGGYIVRIDWDRNAYFTTSAGTLVGYSDPRATDITTEQAAWLHAWFDDMEAVFLGDDWQHPTEGYRAWLHTDCWVDHFIVNELTHNIDAYRLSTYHYKDADSDGGLFHAGPAWDFNLAWGNVDYCYTWAPEGFVIDSLTACGYPYQFPFWWNRLLSDEAFTSDLRCRWEALRQDALSDEALLAAIELQVEGLGEIEARDHDHWGTIGVDVSPNYYVGGSYEDEVEWMTAWILARVAWLDGNMPGTCG